MLLIWTEADAANIRKYVGATLSELRTPHKFIPNLKQFPQSAAPGDVVLACGAKALEFLLKAGLIPKNRTITSMREQVFSYQGIPVLLSFDCGLVNQDYGRLADITWDLILAARLHNSGTLKPKTGEYRCVESLHELIERVEAKFEATGIPVDLACDLETKSKDPFNPAAWIISASFTVDVGKSDVVYFDRDERPMPPPPFFNEDEMDYWQGLWCQIHWLLTTPKVSLRGANFKYDENWLVQKWGILPTNQKFDTVLVGTLLDENRCVAPETLILTSDLRWVRADSLQSGDSVVGFDEHGDQGIHRRMRKSLVSSSEVIKKRRLKLNLSNGHSIVVSDNHQFLCKKYPSTHVKVWRKAKNIQPGCVIFSATPHPKDIQGGASDYELGRLSGFLDGEGSVPKLNDFGSWHLGWGQIPHSAHQDMKRVASLIKAEYREHDDNLNLCKSVVFKGAWNSLHALIATRPLRLVAKEPWDNGPLPRGDEAVSVSVLSVEDLGVGPVVALETTTHTFIAEGLLSHNSNSLKMHTKLLTEMGGYEDEMDKYDMSCLELVPKEELVQYNGGDTDGTLRVAIKMKEQLLKDRALSNFYVKLLQPSAKVFAKMERTGVLVDQPYYAQLKGELESEIKRLSDEMLLLLPAKLRFRHHEKIEAAMAKGKSPFIPALMKEFFFTPHGMNLKPQMVTAKTKEPSTAVEHLLMFGDNPEAKAFVDKFKELGSATKTYTTYVVGFLKHLRDDGRFHSSYMLFKGEYGDDDDSGTNCLMAGSLLLTQRGWVRVVDIVVGDLVLTHSGNWKPVTDLVDNGVKKVFKVTTASGHVLRCTANHKFFTPYGWVRTDALTPGAEVHTYGTTEQWVTVSGFPSYSVSSWGRVRNQKTLQMVAPQAKGSWGHLKVCLVRGSGCRANGDRKDFSVHRLVASHFIPNTNGYPEVRHIDGVSGNNCVWNLCWGSSKDNSEDARSHGTLCREGQKHTKLDWEKVAYIRSHGKGFDRSLALELGVSRELVRDVRLGLKWITPNEYQYSYSWGSSPVVSVEYLGEFPTYDATVHGDHSYVVDGLITHNTGRTSAKDPAIQTIPKHNKWAKRLRRAFVAPPGYVLLNCDFSQGELRIAAVLSEEPVMIQAYADGMDLHSITAAQLSGYEMGEFMLLPEDLRDELRSGGKAGNFGLLYGMQALGFKDYAYNSYGVVMTEEEAFNKRNAFFDLYSRLLPWHDQQKGYAKLHGYVRSPLGRIRHLPLIGSTDRESRSKAERQSINSPVQSCLSDMMQLAMVHIDREFGHEDIHFCMMCHDAITLYVPEADAVKWAKNIKGVMETLPLAKDFNWNSPLKFVADAEVGLTFDALKKLKGL